MEVGDDDASDTASQRSVAKSAASRATGASRAPTVPKPRVSGTVAKLRPSKPVVMFVTDSILAVSKAMADARTDSAILTGGDANLAGIVTSTDVTRKVVALGKLPTDPVSSIMTPNPKCVSMEDDATEALVMMMDNHFRHLPVLDSEGGIVAVLDIAKCMNDAISKIEKLEEMGKKAGGSSDGASEALKVVTAGMLKGAKGSKAQQVAALQAMMASVFGGSESNLLAILSKRDFEDIVSPDMTVREAAKYMAKIRKGVAVVDGSGELVGIFTLKDMNNRVVAKDLSPDTTLVGEVMTGRPESVSSDMSLLETLHLMHDSKFTHVPVVDGEAVKGLVDAMDVMNATMGDGSGKDGWRTFWEQTMEFGDDNTSDTASQRSNSSSKLDRRQQLAASVPLPRAREAARLRLPSVLDEASDLGSQDLNGMQNPGSPLRGAAAFDVPFTFKVQDPNGNLHKVSASAERLSQLVETLCERLKTSPPFLRIKYTDEDGDEVVVVDDTSLAEAVDHARAKGDNFMRLKAEIDESSISSSPPSQEQTKASSSRPPVPEKASATTKGVSSNQMVIYGGAAAALVTLALAGVMIMRRRADRY